MWKITLWRAKHSVYVNTKKGHEEANRIKWWETSLKAKWQFCKACKNAKKLVKFTNDVNKCTFSII